MKWDAKSILLAGALGLMVLLGLVWVAQGLRRQEPRMVVNPSAPSVSVALHPDLEAGIEAVRGERFDEARALFEGVPDTHPSYTVALQNLGALLERLGETAAAVEAYERIIGVEPNSAEPFLRLARIELRGGRPDRAEWYALRALEIDPNSVAARYDVALFRVADDRIADAVVAYARAMRIDPQGIYAPEAVRKLRKLGAERPDLAGTHYALAFFANKREDRAEEVEALERYLALSPTGEAAETARRRLEDARAASDAQESADSGS